MNDNPGAKPPEESGPKNTRGDGKPNNPEQEVPNYQEAVWTYRGYRMRASEFNTAMVHFFRAEVSRANIWRTRLDTTTNWAVVTTGAALSFAFSQMDSNHIVILLNMALVTLFLSIEARRYRYYELWSSRVRLMETDFFASMLVPPFHPSADWAETLAENLLHPDFPISGLEAFGRRLRRNYALIYNVVGVAWLAKLYLLPQTAPSWQVFVDRARIGAIPGEWVLISVLSVYLVLIAISFLTIPLQEASGEVLPRYGGLSDILINSLSQTGKASSSVRAWFRPSRHRQQLLTLIITDQARAVAERILKDMGRGVTSLTGTGMYTGKEHMVLMCALAVTEVPQLKALVGNVDPNAFVVVTPAQEVFGQGFIPLKEDA